MRRGIDLDHRARRDDAAHARKHGVQGLVESRARTADLEIGRARQRVHALRQLLDGAGVDQLHGEAEGDAQRERQDRQRGAPAVLRERAAQQRSGRRDGGSFSHPTARGARPARA
jgi:hypothetical protein